MRQIKRRRLSVRPAAYRELLKKAVCLRNGRRAYALLAVLLLTSSVFLLALPTGSRPAVAANDTRIAYDDAVLGQYIKEYGPDQTIAYIKTLGGVDCHQRVHHVGRTSYELYGDNAFKLLNSECMSGYTHGVTEAFFRAKGTENLSSNLTLICQADTNSFYSHQCYHGIGHGLMAYNDYDLPAALENCDQLPQVSTHRESCYSGVFMENVVGAIAVEEAKRNPGPANRHVSSYLSNDPLYPCTAVNPPYKSACYMYQSSRMIQIYGPDYKKVTMACQGIEVEYRVPCFLSMGRDISNSYGAQHQEIEKNCNYSPDEALRLSCISGAAQDKFWHESEQDEALALCRDLSAVEAKKRCYVEVDGRAATVIASSAKRQSLCAKFEPDFSDYCSAIK